MAYGLKYSFEYRSPMREKLLYTVRISERDYVGEAMLLKPIGEDFVLTQGQIDDDELVPTKPSELTMSLLCTEEGDPLTELFTTDPTQYMVNVDVCRTNAEGYDMCKILWSGYISTGGYSQPYAKPPYRVTIHANDGLAILQTMPYLAEDGSMFTGVKSISQHINEIMSHISVRPTRVWPSYQLYVGQTENIFDTIGLSAEAIYSAFNDETPTYYDVLASILRNFGLQIFQSYGTWIARPLSALIAKRRPDWYRDVSEGFGLGNIDRTLPLYGSADDGYGMSTSAVMSLTPPLKEVTTTAEAPTYTVMPASAKNPRLWQTVGVGVKKAGTEGVVLQWIFAPLTDTDAKENIAGHTFDFRNAGSDTAELTLSFKAFNRENKESTVDLLVGLCSPTHKDSWVNEIGSALSGFYLWNEDEQLWGTGKKTTTFDMPAYSYNIGTRKVSKSVMDKHAVDVSVTLKGLPYPSFYLCFGIRGFRTCEIYDVTIELAQNGLTIEGENTPFVVSPFGTSSIEITQKYPSIDVFPLTANAFAPTVVDVETLKPVAGMLSPADTSSIAGAVASGLQAMRGGVTRTLEGEVYIPSPIDLNTLWRDRDGRAYYTNYIKTLAKRGVYSVQLCELLPLARLEQDALPVTLPGMFMTNIIGMGNSVFYTTLTTTGLYLTDVNSSKSKLVHEKSAPYLYVRKGYRCVCAIDYTVVGNAHKIVCSAYDAAGMLLSSVELDNAIIADLVISSINGIVETICYDKLCDVWYCAYWNGEYIRTAIFDSSGARLFWANIGAVASRPDKIAVHAVNNGFILSYTTPEEGFAYLHNNAMHEGSTCGKKTQLGEVLAIADKYITFRRNTQIIVKPRTEIEVVADGEAVASFSDSEYEFVCNNQILVVLRHIRTRTLKVLDVRTLREVNIDSELFASSVWLNGEWLRTWANDKFYKQRISDGDGYIYEELYDSNGQQLRDMGGNVLRVIKE